MQRIAFDLFGAPIDDSHEDTQPAAHWRQVLAYQVSWPGSTSSGGCTYGSSAMLRMAGPNPAATAVIPAIFLMKSRREIFWVIVKLFVARETVCQAGDVRFGLLQMTVQAPVHAHLDHRPVDCHVA